MDSEVKTQEVRPAAWAGKFYPAEPGDLTRDVAALFSHADKIATSGDVVALIAPHAGYAHSGAIAASAYKLLEGRNYDTVILVSPSHAKYFGGISIYNGGAYETPLGEVKTDIQVAKKLARAAGGRIYLSSMGHMGGEQAEHATEVQLPFLQIVLGPFSLVAVVMGDPQDWRTLGDALASVAQDRRVLLVASSDMSHFHSTDQAQKLDGAVRKAVEDYDIKRLDSILQSGKGEACGGGAILACMHAARNLGAREAVITGYGNSSQSTGDESSVVGYLGAAFLRSEVTGDPKTYVIDETLEADKIWSAEDRNALNLLARQSIASVVHDTDRPSIRGVSRLLRKPHGAFVTIKSGGELRGCMGSALADSSLVELVINMAASAASRDPRFEPVREEELADLEVEVSVLSPLTRCEEVELVEIGRHGLAITKGNRSGVLLPQVAVEEQWDRDTFLQQICVKAGMPAQAWRDSAAVIYTFEVEIM